MRPTNFTEFSTFPGISRSKVGKFSTYAAEALVTICTHYDGSIAYRKWAVAAMYTLAYHVQNDDHVDYTNLTIQKLKEIPTIDESQLRECFKSSFIPIKEIVWDVSEEDQESTPPLQVPAEILSQAQRNTHTVASKPVTTPSKTDSATSKDDLYLSPPKYPRFDTSAIWFAQKAPYDRTSIIYKSLPTIPRNQNEVSITTNVDEMLDSDVLKLFPSQVIPTRKPPMYTELPGIKFHEDLGLILPIPGFTEKQRIENVIKYPHLYQLKREVDGQIVPFHQYIEIDGQLHESADIWDTLAISKLVPKTPEFIAEYVTRLYLLERDARKIEHKYPMLGTLDAFLTLFGPPEFYQRHGFKDAVSIARTCVRSRVSYRQSRNGVLANSGVGRCIYSSFCFQPDCKLVCPTYQQIDYLLDQNNITPPDALFSAPDSAYDTADTLLQKYQGQFVVVQTDQKSYGDYINTHPNEFVKILTYCSICNNWKGSKYSMSVYNLKFSKYVERIRASWTMSGEPDDLQYMRIWSNSAKVLIISNLDYVSFGDVECQSLLQLIQDREEQGKTTIVACKDIGHLVGRSSFFNVFLSVLKGGTAK